MSTILTIIIIMLMSFFGILSLGADENSIGLKRRRRKPKKKEKDE